MVIMAARDLRICDTSRNLVIFPNLVIKPRPLTFLILRRSSSAPEKSNTAPVKKIDLACTIVSDLDLSANGRLHGGVQTAAKIALRVYLRREG